MLQTDISIDETRYRAVKGEVMWRQTIMSASNIGICLTHMTAHLRRRRFCNLPKTEQRFYFYYQPITISDHHAQKKHFFYHN
jgi:hypothetical protein